MTRFDLAVAAVLGAGAVDADTLLLRNGRTVKISALSCDASVCRITIPGGEAQIHASEVLRVESDEEVDIETTPAEAGSGKSSSPLVGPRSIDQIVEDAARKYALPRALVRAVARAESSLNPAAISPKGAEGIMQLMPATARELGVQDAFDPAENIDAGARLLRRLLEKYEGRVAEALAAYNAGEGAVARYKGVPPFRETRGYIRKVVKEFEKAEKQAPASAPPKQQ